MRFHIAVAGAILALATSPIAAQDNAALLACLQQNVVVADAALKPAMYGRTLSFSVTNNMSHAIAGVYVRLVVREAGRSVPWHTDTTSISIPGGVEPGETRALSGYSVLVPRDAPETVALEMSLLDVADAEERPMISEVRFINWASEKSPLACP